MNQFDQLINRLGTDSYKWERYVKEKEGYHDIIPMWIADSDFQACPLVINALQKRVKQGLFGYVMQPISELSSAIIYHLENKHHWVIKKEWIVLLPSLVTGLNLSAQIAGAKGDQIITPSVIYPPFKTAPSNAKRELIEVPLKLSKQRWVIDFLALTSLITSHTRMLFLCNPQNPGGAVYTKKELTHIHQICQQHQLLICSDEIHSDLILEKGVKHTPIASLNKDAASRTITLMAASKAFNVAGLGCGFAIIADKTLRENFNNAKQGLVAEVNLLGQVASAAAFKEGGPWLAEQNHYLSANRDYLVSAINAIKGLSMSSPEATFLAWIDISELALSNPISFFEKAGVGLSAGSDFGDDRFMRLNFACSRQQLEKAVKRIQTAVESHLS